jgi:hypothetical protein
MGQAVHVPNTNAFADSRQPVHLSTSKKKMPARLALAAAALAGLAASAQVSI